MLSLGPVSCLSHRLGLCKLASKPTISHRIILSTSFTLAKSGEQSIGRGDLGKSKRYRIYRSAMVLRDITVFESMIP